MSACGYDPEKVTEGAVGCTPAVCKEMVKNCSVKRITKTHREQKQETEKETARCLFDSQFWLQLPVLPSLSVTFQ